MPRSSRGPAPAARRPAPAPPRPAVPSNTQSRQASTSAYPPQQRAQPQQQGQQQGQQTSGGSGLFGQMASTAAGVAVGSSIGHAIGGFFGGSGSQQSMEAAPQQQDGSVYAQQNTGARPCEMDVTNFRRCMDENQGNLTICGWYLDQLKACQAAAGQY